MSNYQYHTSWVWIRFKRHSPNWRVVKNSHSPSQKTTGPIYRNCQYFYSTILNISTRIWRVGEWLSAPLISYICVQNNLAYQNVDSWLLGSSQRTSSCRSCGWLGGKTRRSDTGLSHTGSSGPSSSSLCMPHCSSRTRSRQEAAPRRRHRSCKGRNPCKRALPWCS
jgi:hypothetical protein